MRVYYSTDFEGHYPVGAGAIITASDETEAKALLTAELEKQGLGGSFTVKKLDLKEHKAIILVNGDY
jgi:hypothetical protein